MQNPQMNNPLHDDFISRFFDEPEDEEDFVFQEEDEADYELPF